MRLSALTAVAATLLVAAPAALGAERGEVPAGGRGGMLAVWALADGDTPFAGARVRVLKDGRPIRGIERRTRTHTTGVALVRFRHLPRRFVVEVLPRGQVGGRMRAVVTNYRSGRVVHVSPVTTLIAAVAAKRQQGRAIDLAAARHRVYELLRIPERYEHRHLRYSDRYFEGDEYLRAARRSGGVAALNRRLVRRALHDGRRTFHDHRKRKPAGARAARVERAELLFEGDLIDEVLAEVFEFAGRTATEAAAFKGDEAALGWVLNMLGLGGEEQLTKQDLDKIEATLQALGEQLTELHGQLSQATYEIVAKGADGPLADIDTATEMLEALANTPAADEDAKRKRLNYAKAVAEFVGSHLIDAPERLNRLLEADIPLADNLLKLASKAVHDQKRFFDKKSSEAVANVYDYFAGYQARLAVLLAEYYHAKPDDYPPKVVEELVGRVQRNVKAQAGSLKPAVPLNTVIDTRTNLMWNTVSYDSPMRSPDHFVQFRPEVFHAGNGDPLYLMPDGQTVARLPFERTWGLPSSEDLDTLLSDRNGQNGVDYMVQAAGFNRGILEWPTSNSHVWVRNTFQYDVDLYHYGATISVYFRLYDLRNAALAPVSLVGFDVPENWLAAFQAYAQMAIYRRPLAPGEEYWWR